MARFGRDFVRAATQPAFTQGLFTAAAGLGSAPRRRREEAEAEAKKQAERNAYSMLAGIQGNIYDTLENQQLTEEERATRLNELRQGALTAAENIEGVNPLTVESMVRTARRDVFAEQEQRRQSERADERLELAFENLGLQKDAAGRAAEKHREFVQSADYRQAQRDFQQNEQQHTLMVRAAEGLSTTDQGRDNFIKAYGENNVGIFDSIKTKNDTAIAQRDKYLADAAKSEFNVSREDLMKKHGFDEKAADNLLAVAKQSPKRASEIFAAYLFNTQKRVEVPSAYVSLFQDAAMRQAEKLLREETRTGYGVSDEAIESKAAEMAIKAANAYVASNGNFEKAMEAVTAEGVRSPENKKEEPSDGMSELRRYDKTYSSVDDAAES